MGSSEFKYGSISLAVDPEFGKYIERLRKEIYPITFKALGEEVAELRDHAEKNWPVLTRPSDAMVRGLEIAKKKGKIKGRLSFDSRDSKGKWSEGARITPTGIEAWVANHAPYSAFVAYPKTKNKKKVHKDLLFKRFGKKRQDALWAKITSEMG